MADWSQLPKDLLHLLSTHLETSTDLLRFRSVCTSWRSSATAKRGCFPSRFPILPNNGLSNTTFGFHLSKRTIFLISLPNPHNQTPPQSWLVKIEEDTPNKKHLLNPLSRHCFDSLPQNFPPILDLSKFRIRELGQEFVLHYAGNLYMEKVVMMTTNESNFLLLTIHVSGKLAIFKSGDKKWTMIEEMPSPYDDVILYKGNFYAVDDTGRMVVVNLDLDVKLVADSVFGGDKKYLVQSEGDLLLVDMYLSIEAEGSPSFEEEEEEEVGYYEHHTFCLHERTVRFKVFRLDEGGKKWEEVKSLGDRVVFLGDDCTFSASAREIDWCGGNCVIFADSFFASVGEEGGGGLECWGISVFDLENGHIAPLGNFPEYCKLIWPPPQWITSTTVDG